MSACAVIAQHAPRSHEDGGRGGRGDRGHLCPDADAPPHHPCDGGDGVRAESRGDEARLFSPPSMTAAGSILGDGALIPASPPVFPLP